MIYNDWHIKLTYLHGSRDRSGLILGWLVLEMSQGYWEFLTCKPSASDKPLVAQPQGAGGIRPHCKDSTRIHATEIQQQHQQSHSAEFIKSIAPSVGSDIGSRSLLGHVNVTCTTGLQPGNSVTTPPSPHGHS